jgi:hypothetical protein
MFPEPDTLRAAIPQLIAERMILRSQLFYERQDNQRLRERIAELQRGNRVEPRRPKPAFDWRHVLSNPDFGWPEDIVAEAKDMRDAERRAGARQ